MKKIGYTWLQDKFNIKGFQLTHESYIDTTSKIELSSTNTIIETFGAKYDIKEDLPLLHLEFALKYDDLNFAFIKEVFCAIGFHEIASHITKNPNRKYIRIIGFLYEFITENSIDVKVTKTNYENVLDSSKYITGDVEKVSKWKVNNNLLGTKKFCPIIRKTTELTELDLLP